MDTQPNFVSSPFDAIRHVDGNREFWKARELSKLLGYSRWENFEKVIAKAKIACEYNGRPVETEFRETTKQRKVGTKGGKADIRDVELTRYACYTNPQTKGEHENEGSSLRTSTAQYH